MLRPRSAAARAAWPAWAAHSVSFRIEAHAPLERMSRAREEGDFAELIARETGKTLWEARTEVGAVVNKVEISIEAYAERTPQRKMEAALGNKIAVRHQPARRACRARSVQFPRTPSERAHASRHSIAGNAVVFEPSEKTPGSRRIPGSAVFTRRRIPEGSGTAARRWTERRQGARRRPGHRRACCSRDRRGPASSFTPPVLRIGARSWPSSSAATIRLSCGTPRTCDRQR